MQTTQPEYSSVPEIMTPDRQDVRSTASPARRRGFGLGKTLAVGGVVLCGLLSFLPSASGLSGDQSSAQARAATLTSNTVSASEHLTFASVSTQNRSLYESVARQAAQQAGINPDLFVRQIQQESGFNPNAVSWVGAIGIAQFMPATAASMGVNPHDPVAALYASARHMADLQRQFGGNYAMALAGYNAGPGAVNSAVARGGGSWQAYLPYETRHYIATILG